jgi:hypothetical protein
VRPTIYTAFILSEAGTGTGARAPGSRVGLIRDDGLGSSKNPENFRVRLALYMIKARSQIVCSKAPAAGSTSSSPLKLSRVEPPFTT